MNVLGDTIEILRGTNATAAQLARLQELLRTAQRTQQSPKEVAAAVERELPAFGELAKRLLTPKTAGDFWTLVGAIIALITLLKVTTPTHDDHSVIVNQVIEQIYEQEQSVPPAAQAARPKTKFAPNNRNHASAAKKNPTTQPPGKVGRNAPCPCGSGRKYKRCCGGIR